MTRNPKHRKPKAVDCPYHTRTGTEHQSRGLCALGYFGGEVTFGACRKCIENGRNTVNAASSPDIRKRFRSFSGSILNWAKTGMKLLDDARFSARLAICKNCQFFASGTCRKCGCVLRMKLRLPTEKCPLDLWGEENYAKPTTESNDTNGNDNNDAPATGGSPELSGESRAEGGRDSQIPRSGAGDRPGQRGTFRRPSDS